MIKIQNIIFLSLFFIAIVAAQDDKKDAIKINAQETAEGYDFYIENNEPHVNKVMVNVILLNMLSDTDFPYIATLPGNSKKSAFKTWVDDKEQPFSYQISYKWRKAYSRSSSCADDVFCIITELRGDSLHFYLENKQFVPVSVKFIPDNFQNLQTDQKLPFTKTYAGHKKTKMFTAWLQDVWGGWRQGFHYPWQYGIAGAKHDDSYVYALPYARGQKFEMIQGPNGEYSHRDKFAYDWAMPEGTPIHAAREGIVIAIEAGYDAGGSAAHFKKEANFVEIMHYDGTVGRYSHLQKNGARVNVKDRIERGQKIGLSGNTGYSAGPHLHFDVIRLTENFDFESIPLLFKVSKNKTKQIEDGDIYKAFE